MNVQNDKTVDDDVFILTLPAIAHAMDKEGVDNAKIALGVGLPITLFGAQKERFRKYFLRDNIEFSYGDKAYNASIVVCQVFPQGFSALCRYHASLSKFSSLTLIDIGGFTIDVMQARSGRADKKDCRSLPIGTITLFNNIKDDLLKESISLSDIQITDAYSGNIEHLRRPVILEIIRLRSLEYIKQLLNALREMRLDLEMPTVFTGGGAEILNYYLQSKDVNYVGTLDKFANAEGFKMLLEW